MTQIKLRRDTAANFTSKNPVLGQGEPAYETDTKKMKIGDGTTAYNDLAYFDTGGGTAPSNMVTTDTVQELTRYKYMPSLVFGTLTGPNYITINSTQAAIKMDYNGNTDTDSTKILYCQSNFWKVGRSNLPGKIGSNTNLVRVEDGPDFNEYPIFDTSNISNYIDGSTITWDSSTNKLSSSGGSSSPSTMFPFAQVLDKTRLNLNNATTNGLWYYSGWSGSNPKNTPLDNNDAFFLEVLRYQDDNLSLHRTLQRLTYVYPSSINKTYIRSGIFTGYTQWTPWAELGGSSSSSTSKAMIPDTTAAIDIATGSNNYWTAPADGVVFTGATASTGRGFAVHEGHNTDETFSYIKSIVTVAGGVYAYGWFPVVTGQQITFSFSTPENIIKKFCPYKEIEVS